MELRDKHTHTGKKHGKISGGNVYFLKNLYFFVVKKILILRKVLRTFWDKWRFSPNIFPWKNGNKSWEKKICIFLKIRNIIDNGNNYFEKNLYLIFFSKCSHEFFSSAHTHTHTDKIHRKIWRKFGEIRTFFKIGK